MTTTTPAAAAVTRSNIEIAARALRTFRHLDVPQLDRASPSYKAAFRRGMTLAWQMGIATIKALLVVGEELRMQLAQVKFDLSASQQDREALENTAAGLVAELEKARKDLAARDKVIDQLVDMAERKGKREGVLHSKLTLQEVVGWSLADMSAASKRPASYSLKCRVDGFGPLGILKGETLIDLPIAAIAAAAAKGTTGSFVYVGNAKVGDVVRPVRVNLQFRTDNDKAVAVYDRHVVLGGHVEVMTTTQREIADIVALGTNGKTAEGGSLTLQDGPVAGANGEVLPRGEPAEDQADIVAANASVKAVVQPQPPQDAAQAQPAHVDDLLHTGDEGAAMREEQIADQWRKTQLPPATNGSGRGGPQSQGAGGTLDY